jgi:hypothetical protein
MDGMESHSLGLQKPSGFYMGHFLRQCNSGSSNPKRSDIQLCSKQSFVGHGKHPSSLEVERATHMG